MTSRSGGPAADQGSASKPTEAERDREPAGPPGNTADKAGGPATGTSPADECAPIDLDCAHDRAS